MSAVDGEVGDAINALRALSVTPGLDSDDLHAFYTLGKKVLASQPSWNNLLVHDTQGRQLLNASLPWGSTLLSNPIAPASIAQAVSSGRPAVGNLAVAPLLQNRLGIPVRVPVMRDGKVIYVLTAVLEPAAVVLASGSVSPKVQSAIREIALLSNALDRSAHAIAERDRNLHQSQEELRKQAAELRRADTNRSQFLALLAHELRNPLAPLRTGVAILFDAAGLETGRGHARDDGASGRAHGTADPRPHRCESYRARSARAASRSRRSGFGRAQCRGDRQAGAGSEAAAACRSIRGGSALLRWRFAQAESGVGEPAQQRLQVHGARRPCRLVRSIVAMHGGRIDAQSEGPGRGATFTLHLPKASTAATAPSAVSVPLLPTNSGRVLVVDDNMDAAESLAAMLRLHGFHVRATYDGAQALEVAGALRPEVAFIDLTMPGMSGIELAAALRADASIDGLRLVALTGMGQKSDLDATRRAGFEAHLTKPAQPEEIVRLAAAKRDNVVPIRAERPAT